MKRVIIVHGYTGHPDKNWFPWLKEQLSAPDIQVFVPQMPHPEEPQLDEWLAVLKDVVVHPDKEVYFVGHSLGCIAVLQYLNALKEGEKIGGCVLVAGFAEPIDIEATRNFMNIPLDEEHIKKTGGAIIAINSDNDPYVPLWQGEHLRDRFNAELIVMHHAGHLNERFGFVQLPIVLQQIEKMI